MWCLIRQGNATTKLEIHNFALSRHAPNSSLVRLIAQGTRHFQRPPARPDPSVFCDIGLRPSYYGSNPANMAGTLTAYEGSPQDEGYSEAPLTVGSSGSLPLPSWVADMSVPERMGMCGIESCKKRIPYSDTRLTIWQSMS